jgi:C-terminal processing protease CtpA/Prc
MVNDPLLQKSLKVGDVIVGIKTSSTPYEKIGYSIYNFDKIVDQHVGEKVTLKVFRRTGDTIVFNS